MTSSNHSPVKSFTNLKERVDRFFRKKTKTEKHGPQFSLDLFDGTPKPSEDDFSNEDVTEFINFLADATPNGELYLFGGILRDIALFGRKGFNSDIDIVMEGDWQSCEKYIQAKGARKNKFGGYRLYIENWPIDIWNAKNTWAISQGLVEYKGIFSLTETTILNWDAILMNWRTGNFVTQEGFLASLQERKLDIVLEQNPNPKGMAVRVFRHLCMKDARKITPKAAEYLSQCTTNYSFEDLQKNEIGSYGNTLIEYAIYRWFELLMSAKQLEFPERTEVATYSLKDEGIVLSQVQKQFSFYVDLNETQ